jgi:hypothetical protein
VWASCVLSVLASNRVTAALNFIQFIVVDSVQDAGLLGSQQCGLAVITSGIALINLDCTQCMGCLVIEST